MARASLRVVQNVPGEFFVDSTCIDCDTCRQIAPEVFGDTGEGSAFVKRQPESDALRRRALMALVSCPTASIGSGGSVEKLDARAAVDAFPEEIADGVFYCGFASPDSYGASSYLVVRPGGNVLVDSPRAAAPLMKRIEAMGRVRWMFLTHRDDVADHAKWRARFGCERVMHRDDLTRGTRDVERVLEGREPVALDAELVAIPTPGHTRGHHVLSYRDRFLFTGDHLWWDDDRARLWASKSVCWYSWPEQARSMELLLNHRFEWVLPGHGRRHHAPAPEMRAELERLVAAMKARG